MTLFVQSAQFAYRGGWRLDITRKSGTTGLFLAPSWEILRPALEARKEAAELLARAARFEYDPREAEGDARHIEQEAWEVYKPLFIAEMRVSVKARWSEWKALLGRERVVLVCYCADAQHCHRTILREEILPRLGATDGGEIPI